jgi:TPR repeat protein
MLMSSPENRMKPCPASLLLIGFVALTCSAASAQRKGVDPALLAKAKAGDAHAQLAIGQVYEEGIAVPQDYAQAASWFQKAADQDLAKAQDELGFLYHTGNGVAQDDTKAAAWFRRAANQNLASAELHLGLLYDHGEGVPQDFAQAAGWYRKAALQGDPDAQYDLGTLYERGLGVPQDYTQAADLYRRAAEQGNAGAQFNLGLLYDNGTGIARDYAQAASWYKKAAEQGPASRTVQPGHHVRQWPGSSGEPRRVLLLARPRRENLERNPPGRGRKCARSGRPASQACRFAAGAKPRL